ncbi:NCS2 family permease [Lachnobacterium bovis]|uniref:Putative MFS transporter, AGZA family, xanthine/uracil permease n=1 Tax=Lachnobacterium bovis TaxID=140626 RepID=A0A1H9P5L5_9FIRM|nr:NCS2 family permease [Lachnobacterium bovis]SER43536.1 putative MFS transporter, AGZA family, xanthine/uracil permease [Lachnobacterium bovis]
MLEKMFHLKENHTTVKREVIGGITTFMTMAYILALNPSILSSAKGMDKNAVLMATALAAFIGTMAMALLANYPFALAPGLGLNAYFAFTVCGSMGYSYKVALLAVFAEGIIFIVLSLTNIREAIFNAIPTTLKKGVSVGIGLFVAFIGLQGAKIVTKDESTLVKLVNFKENFNTVGIGALLAIIGVLVIVVFSYYNVKGSLLLGILITWGLGIICELAGIYKVGPTTPSLIPSLSTFDITAIGKTFGQCFDKDIIKTIHIFDFITVIFAFLFVDIFDTLGTLVGVATKADLLDEDGKLPRIKPALLADAIATTVGAILGTSTTTTFVESTAGVAEGARTGLASVVTGLLFLVSIVLSPIFIAIPSFATAPALIYVGFLMISAVVDIDFNDFTEAIPAYLAIIAMPLTYSISEGIAFGVISYTIVNVCAGKFKKITPLMYVLSVLFVLKFVFL